MYSKSLVDAARGYLEFRDSGSTGMFASPASRILSVSEQGCAVRKLRDGSERLSRKSSQLDGLVDGQK